MDSLLSSLTSVSCLQWSQWVAVLRCSCPPRPRSRWVPLSTVLSPTPRPPPTRPAAPSLRTLVRIGSSCDSALTSPCPDSPGRGVMGTARELPSKYPSPILDVTYRRRQLEFRRRQISQWLENETELLHMEIEARGEADKSANDYVAERFASIEREAKRQESEALATYGMLAGQDPSIAPLRRALAVWGLTIDDVGVASVSLAIRCGSLRTSG